LSLQATFRQIENSKADVVLAGRIRRKVFVVLLAYNEEGAIGELFNRIAEAMDEVGYAYQIVLVDDGSSDATARVVTDYAARLPIVMKRHEHNLGLGATIRDGLVAAAELAADRDIIATMDSDGTHAPGLILRMVRMIMEGCDVVIASRYQPSSRTVGVPFSRRILSYLACVIFRVLFPTKGVKDFTCGYRAYRAEIIKALIRQYGELFGEEGFECMVDIILRLRKMHVIFGEAPLILRYDVKSGKSKMNVREVIKMTFLLALRRRIGK